MSEPVEQSPTQSPTDLHPLAAFDLTRTLDPVAAEKFRVRAKGDVERVLERLERLRTIAGSRTYAYTFDQVMRIRDAIQAELDSVCKSFTDDLEQMRRASESPTSKKTRTSFDL